MSTEKATRVAVLGSTGMLGAMVTTIFSESEKFQVVKTARSSSKVTKSVYFDAIDFVADSNDSRWKFLDEVDYIINCIGIIKPFCHDDNMTQVETAIRVNALFPHLLAQRVGSKARVIQIATDCVYSGRQGKYVESDLHDAVDVYGQTKSLGEARFDNVLHLRCSIVGPETGTSKSLLEWFLSQSLQDKPQVSGYTNHYWNGITTLQFAQLCQLIIEKSVFDEIRAEHFAPHFIPNSTVTKHQLLELFQKYFKTDVEIKAVAAPGEVIDRTLATQYSTLEKLFPAQSMDAAIAELASFVNNHPAWRRGE